MKIQTAKALLPLDFEESRVKPEFSVSCQWRGQSLNWMQWKRDLSNGLVSHEWMLPWELSTQMLLWKKHKEFHPSNGGSVSQIVSHFSSKINLTPSCNNVHERIVLFHFSVVFSFQLHLSELHIYCVLSVAEFSVAIGCCLCFFSYWFLGH